MAGMVLKWVWLLGIKGERKEIDREGRDGRKRFGVEEFRNRSKKSRYIY